MRSRVASSGRYRRIFVDALVVGGEENGFHVFDEAIGVTGGALGEKEALAGGDLEAFVDELVLVGVGEEAEVDFGAPDGFAVVLVVELALAVDGGGRLRGRGQRRHISWPETTDGEAGVLSRGA